MRRSRLGALILASTLAVTLSACGASSNQAKPKPKKQYGQIYYADGHCYARTYNDSGTLVWYILFASGQTQPASYSSAAQAASSSFAGSSWKAAATPPSAAALASTAKVVEANDKGEPTDVVEDESAVPQDLANVTTQDTTAEQAQTDVQDANAGSGVQDGSNPGSGVQGGSGDQGGGDSGGGGDGGGGGGGGGDGG